MELQHSLQTKRSVLYTTEWYQSKIIKNMRTIPLLSFFNDKKKQSSYGWPGRCCTWSGSKAILPSSPNNHGGSDGTQLDQMSPRSKCTFVLNFEFIVRWWGIQYNFSFHWFVTSHDTFEVSLPVGYVPRLQEHIIEEVNRAIEWLATTDGDHYSC